MLGGVTMRAGYAAGLLLVLVLGILSPQALWADASSTIGSPANPGEFSVITVDTNTPNPYTIGIASGTQNSHLTVTVLPEAGLLVGGSPGINLWSTSTVTNNGTITATTNAFAGILGINGNSITNNGDIFAQGNGIFLQGNNIVTHAGMVSSSIYSGIVLGDDNSLTITGPVVGADTGVLLGDRNTLISTADLVGTSGPALHIGSDNGGPTYPTKSVSQTGNLTSTSGDGLTAGDRNTVILTGNITAGSRGIALGSNNLYTGTGAIHAAADGIRALSENTLTHTGAITSTGASGIYVGSGVAGTPQVINQAGTITAAATGLFAGNYSTITVDGNISAGTGHGIQVNSNNTLTYDGTLNSSIANGIHAVNQNTMTTRGSVTGADYGVFGFDNNTLTNYGSIASGGGSEGVWLRNNSNITNAGIITGANGTAVKFQGGTNTLTLETGSVLNGSASGGPGDDTLIFEGSGTEDSAFESFETLVMAGTDWTLSGASSVGTAIVLQGVLRVNGTLVSTTTVNTGASLGGTGTLVGNVTNNGKISPGNSIGTTTILGDLVQGPNSEIEIETENGMGDLVQVSGTASLAGNLHVIHSGPDVAYSALTAGTVTGTFDTVTHAASRVQTVVSYTANSVDLATVSPAGLDARTDLALRNGTLLLDTLSGRLHGRQGVMTGTTRSPNASLYGPYQSTALDDRGFWFRGLGQYGERSESEGVLGSETRLTGLVLGGDNHLSDHSTFGGAFAYTQGDAEVEQDVASTSADSYMLGAYYGYERETSDTARFFFDASLGGGLNSYDSQRNVFNQGTGSLATANFDGTTLGARLASGMDFAMGYSTLRPMGIVDYIWAHQDAHSETGAGATDVQYDAQDAQALKLAALLAFTFDVQVGDSTLTPEIRAGVAHEMAMDDRTVGGRIPGLGGAFALPGNDQDETRGVLGLGGSWWFQDSFSAFLDANGEFGSETKTYTLTGGMRFLF